MDNIEQQVEKILKQSPHRYEVKFKSNEIVISFPVLLDPHVCEEMAKLGYMVASVYLNGGKYALIDAYFKKIE